MFLDIENGNFLLIGKL